MSFALNEILAYFLVSIAVAAFSIKYRALDNKGLASAFFLGLIIVIFLSFRAFLILLFFFITASISTKIGYEIKEKRGKAQKIRSMENVLANGIMPAIAAFLAGVFSANTALSQAFTLCYIATICEAISDTLSNELGQLSPEKPRLITNFKKVEPGENGAFSLFGTFVALAAIIITAALSYYLVIIHADFKSFMLAVIISASLGNIADSFLGATFENRGKIGNNGVNLISSFITFLAAFNLYFLLVRF